MSKPKTEEEFITEWKDWASNRQFKFNYTDEQFKLYYKLYLEKFKTGCSHQLLFLLKPINDLNK
jgi:hypothetical protein